MDLEAVALVALGVAVGQDSGLVFNLEEFISLQDPHQAVDVPCLALNSDFKHSTFLSPPWGGVDVNSMLCRLDSRR